LKHFAPRLQRHGMDRRTIDHMLVDNPRRVFSATHRT
jgi:phosphotriesterase-related protein